jgi:hypothetical protein
VADYTQTADQEVVDHYFIEHPDSLVSADIDVSTKLSAQITLLLGYVEAVALASPLPKFVVQGSTSATGDDTWMNLVEFQATDLGTPADETLSGAESDNTLAVTSTAGFDDAGTWLYIQDTTNYDA